MSRAFGCETVFAELRNGCSSVAAWHFAGTQACGISPDTLRDGEHNAH